VQWLRILQWQKWVHLQKLHVFRNPLRPIPSRTTSPSSPNAREPISVAIPSDLLGKIRVKMEDVNVSNVRERWTRWWEGETYIAFTVQGHCIEGASLVVRCQCRWKEKKWWRSKGEAKKRIRRKNDSLWPAPKNLIFEKKAGYELFKKERSVWKITSHSSPPIHLYTSLDLLLSFTYTLTVPLSNSSSH
jgi:hypothetical protein